jgi:hypothetical protein
MEMAEVGELARHISRILDKRVKYVENPDCYRLYLATRIDDYISSSDLFHELKAERPSDEGIVFCVVKKCADGKVLIGVVVVKNQEYTPMEHDADLEHLLQMARQ